MGKRSSSSQGRVWRYLQPRYYMKRPKRLALIVMACISITWLVYDRQAFTTEYQEEIMRLKEEVILLKNRLKDANKHVKDSAKSISNGDKIIKSTLSNSIQDDPCNEERRAKVKNAMLHAWTSYEKYAWGQDELQPQSKDGVDNFGGLGATIVDSLDTLIIMGLEDQFQRAKEWVASSLNFNKDIDVSVFETTIRVVGGLLSAYDLSGDKIFLEKATDIADRLLPAWNTPSGIPYNRINLVYGNAKNPTWTQGNSILADSGSEQLEFIALSQRTKEPKYQQKVENVIKEIHRTFPADGLLPIYINPHTGIAQHSTVTFGAMGDSFYEYLLKAWIQGNKTEVVKYYREMWEASMKGLRGLIRKSAPSSFTYICEKNGNDLYNKMDELACFVPGMLALGSSCYGPGEAEKFMSLAEEIIVVYSCFGMILMAHQAWQAETCFRVLRNPVSLMIHLGEEYLRKKLAWTCYNFYQLTPTKLAGENYFFRQGEDMNVGISWNIQRPETIESLFYLWRLTGNKTYQEWGWNIFQAFERNSRVETGYVGLRDVRTGDKDNMMQSFFLAETLKYLYLLFSPPSVIPLDEWVFNTEAHPLRIVNRDAHPEALNVDQAPQEELNVDQGERLPRHIHGRKEGRLD